MECKIHILGIPVELDGTRSDTTSKKTTTPSKFVISKFKNCKVFFFTNLKCRFYWDKRIKLVIEPIEKRESISVEGIKQSSYAYVINKWKNTFLNTPFQTQIQVKFHEGSESEPKIRIQ